MRTKKRRRGKPLDRRATVLRESLKYRTDVGEPPKDIDVFRIALCREIQTLLGDWRSCREAVCRRVKHCAGPHMLCHEDNPPPPSTPEDDARMRAEFLHAMAQHGAESGG